MYTNTPTSKFLVLSPTESGPDSINAPEVPAPQYDTPQNINLTPSTGVSSTTSNENVLSPFQNGFLYLGYQNPQSPITSSSTPSSKAIAESVRSPSPSPTLQCLPLTGFELRQAVKNPLPRSDVIPDTFRMKPLFLNFWA